MSTGSALKFTAVTALPAQPGEWWTVLVEGNYKHPKHGDIPLPKERLLRFHEHYQQGFYGQDVPLDLNHETGDQGAPGWLQDTRVILGTEGGQKGKHLLQIKPRLNSYGRLLVEDERVKYLSAEFYDQFDTFEHGTVPDLMTGVALTQRPHMKNLGPIKFTETAPTGGAAGDNAGMSVLYFEEEPTMAGTIPTPTTSTPAPAPAAPAPAPVQATEGMVSLVEFQAEQKLREAAEAKASNAERIALGEQLKRELTETQTAFAQMKLVAGDDYKITPARAAKLAVFAMRFAGDPPVDAAGHVQLAEDGKTPVPSERQDFINEICTLAQGIVALGTKGFAADPGEQGDKSPAEQLDAAVRTRMTEHKETYDVALEHVMKDQPDMAGKGIMTE